MLCCLFITLSVQEAILFGCNYFVKYFSLCVCDVSSQAEPRGTDTGRKVKAKYMESMLGLSEGSSSDSEEGQ